MKKNRRPGKAKRGHTSKRKSPSKRTKPIKSKGRSKSVNPIKPKMTARRRAFLKSQADAAYIRRVRYAKGRNKPLPEPSSKSQANQRDKFVIEYDERNPPGVREKKRERDQHYRDRKKLEKEYKVKTRHSKRGKISDIIYPVPFKVTQNGAIINRQAMEEIFRIESKHDRPGRPRIIKAYIGAIFRHALKYPKRPKGKVIWFQVKYPVLAIDGPEKLIKHIEAKLAQYAIEHVSAIEIVASYK